MKFIMTRPGITLIIVGIIAWFLRKIIDGVPVVGGLFSGILFFAAIFFVIGGLWIFVMGRAADKA